MRSTLPRLIVYSLTAAALVLIGGVFAPWCVGSEESLAHVAGVLYHELQRGEALSSRDERVRRCLEAKWRITTELLEGRLTLEEAAEGFREWNEATRHAEDAWVDPYRPADDEESVYRNVIAWARQRTSNDPERQAAVYGRLAEELRQLRQARSGGAL